MQNALVFQLNETSQVFANVSLRDGLQLNEKKVSGVLELDPRTKFAFSVSENVFTSGENHEL